MKLIPLWSPSSFCLNPHQIPLLPKPHFALQNFFLKKLEKCPEAHIEHFE